jgi:autotransporter-associated beta strand protein
MMTRAKRNRIVHYAVLAVPLVSAATASALTWDANGVATGTGGNGNWTTDSSTLNWDNGTAFWTDNSPATLAGTAGLVTLTSAIAATSLTFNTAGYTLELNGNTLGYTSISTTGTTNFTGSTLAGTSVLNAAAFSSNQRFLGNLAVVYSGGTANMPAFDHTFTGALSLTGSGTVTAAKNAQLGSAAGIISISGSKVLSINPGGSTETITRNIVWGSTGGFQVSGPKTVTLTGTVSGVGFKTSNTEGATVLAGNNTFTGALTIGGSGTALIAASANAFGADNPGGASNTIEVGSNASTIGFMGGVDVASTRTINATGAGRTDGAGNIRNYSGNNSFSGNFSMTAQQFFTAEEGSQLTWRGQLNGSRALALQGGGTLVLTNATNSIGVYSSGTISRRILKPNEGTIRLDFNQSTATANILNQTMIDGQSGVIAHDGGTFDIRGKDGTAGSPTANSQWFATGMLINPGASTFSISNGAFNTVTVRLGAFGARQVGGTLDFVLPTGAQVSGTNGFNTSTLNAAGTSIIGGYVTVGKNTWATTGTSGTNAITGLLDASYTDDAWASATTNTTVKTSNAVAFTDVQTYSLRFNETGDRQVLLGGTNTIASGGILVTSAVGSGKTTITGGTLLGRAAADLIVHQHNTGGELVIGSDIADNAGATALTKSGAGTLVLKGNNSYTGKTFINGGVLRLNSAGALPSASHVVFEGGVLGLNSDFNRTLGTGTAANQVQWSGSGGFAAYADETTSTRAVTIGSSVTWNSAGYDAGLQDSSSGVVSYIYKAGGFVGTNSKLIFGSTDATGMVDFQTAIEIRGNTSSTLYRRIEVVDSPYVGIEAQISGAITGAGGEGSWAKYGAGTLALTALNTYTGLTDVNAGTLLVNGNGTTSGVISASSAVSVNNGGTLGGTGAAKGTVTVNSGGRITGGSNGVGTLSTGSLSLKSGSTVVAQVDFANGGSGDQISVTGSVSIDGATLYLDLLNGDQFDSANKTYTLVLNDSTDAITGAGFASITSNAGNELGYTLSNGTGNDYVLTFTSVPEPTSVGVTLAGAGLMLRRRRRARQ